MIRTCKFCQSEFDTEDSRKVFCSQKCGALNSKKNLLESGLCPLCGKEKETNPKTGKKYYYCEEHRGSTHEERECVGCHKKFIARDNRTKYCSKNCASLAFDARRRFEGLCKICGAPTDINSVTGRKYYLCNEHRTIRNDKSVEYYQKNKKAFKKRTHEWVTSLKEKFFEIYGSKCVCCGDSRKIFLTLDHVQGDGHKDRKRYNSPWNAYQEAIKLHNVKRFQVLCANCNFAKRTNGLCPCGGKSYNTK